MSERNPIYDTAPPPELLPAPETRDGLAKYLALAPGIDIQRSIAEKTTPDWPSPGFHALANVRPGFSGNVTITPYQQATYKPIGTADFFDLRGCGGFGAVYDNPQHQPDVPFSDRIFPDFISIPGEPAVVTLKNGGRLHVPGMTTGARGGIGTQHPEKRTMPGVAVVERLLTAEQVRPYMAHLAMGMGLEGPDVETFAALPEQFIEELMPDGPIESAPARRLGSRVLQKILNRLNPTHGRIS